ncbi:hypothetical protein BH24ACT15_BH24ACT15_05720 [soil metagenome]
MIQSMTSAAVKAWRDERSDLLDQLIQAHAAVGGSGAGRRWATVELNRALVLRVASQFQGFTKDLHAEVAITFGSLAQPDNAALARVISTGLQTKRDLDRANAQADSLASDFGRFGIVFWDEMAVHDERTVKRREHLKWFNMARNALAHDDEPKLAKVVDAGYNIDLGWVRRWRSVLNGLAGTMDAVMATHLSRIFDVERPW